MLNSTLAFNQAQGQSPIAGPIIDGSGNLYGTTTTGGANGDGTVYEVASGSGAIAPLASFDGTNGISPIGGVILDTSGNLFGTASKGGANGDGTVFEIVSGSDTITPLASFDGTDGQLPDASLIMDADGNLYGTTNKGGAHNDGNIFEIAAGSGTITPLVSFDGSNGANPYGGLAIDANANLYGTTGSGGTDGDGTVFELAGGSDTFTTLASFDRSNGANPYGTLITDSAGNLYGTTYAGGPSSDGTVFEIASGSGTITTLASFNRTNGAGPVAGLIMDGDGNLFGTTSEGGIDSQGSVFEIAAQTSTITSLFAFSVNSGINPQGGIAMDASGNLYTTAYTQLSTSGGTLIELSQNLPPPTLLTPTKSSINQSITPSFAWSGVSGASMYTLLVATNPADLPTSTTEFSGGPTVVIQNQSDSTTFNSTTPLIFGQQYYWEVIASGTLNGTWSPISSFTVIPPLPAPALTAPADMSINQPLTPTFSWSPVTGATQYRILVASSSSNFPIGQNTQDDGASPAIDQTISTTTFTPTTLLTNGQQYFWEVFSNSPSVTGTWSSISSFTVIPPLPAPTPVTPASAATDLPSEPTFTWSPVPGAAQYRLIIAGSANDLPTDPAVTTGGPSTSVDVTTTDTTYTSSVSLANGMQYSWEVIASAPGVSGAWSQITSFTIIPPLLASTPIAPANLGVNQPDTPTFSWSPVVGATKYRLLVAPSPTDLPSNPYDRFSTNPVIAVTATSTTFTSTTVLSPNQTYYWEVIGDNNQLIGTWSSISSFTILPPLPGPTPIAPANQSLNNANPPQFHWSSVATANTYRLVVATQPFDLYSGGVIAFTTAPATTSVVVDVMLTNRKFTPSVIFTNGTKYYWQVLANSPVTGGIWSSIYSFVPGLSAPSLITPPESNSSQAGSTLPTFTWQPVVDATKYRFILASNKADLPTDPGVITGGPSTLFDATTSSTCYALTVPLSLSTTYYWEVIAKNSTMGGAWSSIGTYTTLNQSNPSGGYSPAMIEQAYDLGGIKFGSTPANGAGQTIAIVDEYNNPTIRKDLNAFDAKYKLPAAPNFTVVNESGNQIEPSLNGPPPSNELSWIGEIDLDVEWAHALAPGANILLVESLDPSNLNDAIQTAANYPGVSVVSMSFGGDTASGQSDDLFVTPPDHTPVTFVAASGDTGPYPSFDVNGVRTPLSTPGVNYPASFANVLSVGGTTLSVTDSVGDWGAEEYWLTAPTTGGGYGVSSTEPLPAYQQNVSPASGRQVPDVSFDANQSTGVAIYSSYGNSSSPWLKYGGTSFSAPAWAAIIAIIDQGRVAAGESTLDGPTQTLPMLYNLPNSDFYKVSAAKYDPSGTGLGTPIGRKLICDMVGASAPLSALAVTAHNSAPDNNSQIFSDAYSSDSLFETPSLPSGILADNDSGTLIE